MIETPPPPAAARIRLAVAAVAALALLEVLWELWLAPVRAGGSWLALKALPLALMWPALARGSRRIRQWLTLLLPAYVAEGVVRGVSETGRHALVATTVAVVAAIAFVALLTAFRRENRSRPRPD